MLTLVVVSDLRDWPLDVPGVRLAEARSYLMEEEFGGMKGARVFNLCRSYAYQSSGYYVSLLAAARGHKPIPNVMTMRDMKNQTVIRSVSDELEETIRASLKPILSERFVLSIYFGHNLARRYEALSQQLFKLFPSPFLKANFSKSSEWSLHSITPLAASEIPEEHRPFAAEAMQEYFAKNRASPRRRSAYRFDLAILYNPADPTRPSDERALRSFVRAAESMGMQTEVITRSDYGRLAQFDALFIRETTAVNHHTYRFARRAEAEGLVVIDDPLSILRCTNKVYLAELLKRHEMPAPRTRIIHALNVDAVLADLGLPCILKQPDSSSSIGVLKAEDEQAFRQGVAHLLESSDLIIAQEFLPTEFDWRIGVLNRQPLFAVKYFMARRHWQIIKRDEGSGRVDYGGFESLPFEAVPRQVVRLGLKAANLMGDGLYGVDLKQVGRKVYVIEVNDNPNIEAGVEDRILKSELYERVMRVLLQRVERRKEGRGAW